MRHAILGVGGVGGFVGAVLAHGGDEVTAIVRPESLARHPSRLTLESPLGSATGRIECSATVEQSCDVLWIAVKATQLDEALAAISAPERIGMIVPLLNGIDHVALLRARYGHCGRVERAASRSAGNTRPDTARLGHARAFVTACIREAVAGQSATRIWDSA